MGADDNILAGITGFTEGVSSVLVPYMQNRQKAQLQDQLAQNQSARELQSAKDLYQYKVPYEKQVQEAGAQATAKATAQYRAQNPIYDEKGQKVGETQGTPHQLKDEAMVAVYDGQGKIIMYVPKGSKQLTAPKASNLQKSDQDKLDQAKSAIAILSKLEGNHASTPSGIPALASRAESAVSFGKLGNQQQRTYEDSLNANAVKFYRQYTGDTRISDADAADRAYKLLPGGLMNKAQAGNKFNDLRRNILINARPQLDRAGISEDDFLKQAEAYQEAPQNNAIAGDLNSQLQNAVPKNAKILKVTKIQ